MNSSTGTLRAAGPCLRPVGYPSVPLGMRPSPAQLHLKSTRTLPRRRSIGHTGLYKASDNAMLILHAAAVEGNLVLWGEDSEQHLTPANRQAAGKHPYGAQARLLAEAIGLETGGYCSGSAIAWLPSQGDISVPSSPMAGPMPKSRAKPRIRPWTVATLPPGTGASRAVAAEVVRATGRETRRRHRTRSVLLDPRRAVGGLSDGPSTVPAQPL